MSHRIEQTLDQLANEVFRTFARFEYALKAAGFHKGEGTAEPNWRSFAESIPDVFDNPTHPSLKEAVSYMLNHPPKGVCPPAEVTFAQTARVAVTYIEARLERMHEDFRVLAVEAMQKAWPCK